MNTPSKAKNAVILHGTDADSTDHWFPWLKTELEVRGYAVWVPNLPGADRPDAAKYVSFLIDSGWDYNENTVLIGHSSGAVAILHLLAQLERKVAISIFVGVFRGDLGWDSLKDIDPDGLDLNRIISKSNRFVFLHSDNDPYCPLAHASYYADELGGELVVLPGQKHFSTGDDKRFRKFPEVLEFMGTGRS